jgi:hypothetical protein
VGGGGEGTLKPKKRKGAPKVALLLRLKNRNMTASKS